MAVKAVGVQNGCIFGKTYKRRSSSLGFPSLIFTAELTESFPIAGWPNLDSDPSVYLSNYHSQWPRLPSDQNESITGSLDVLKNKDNYHSCNI